MANLKKISPIILIAFSFSFLIFLKFTAWPEMTLWPYLMIKGWLPYRDIAIAHNPLLLALLTPFNLVFGIGITQLRVFTYLLIGLSGLLLFFVSERLWSKKVAFVSLVLFFPLVAFFEGNGLWFDLALIPFYLLIYWFAQKRKYFWAGIIWALAFLTKQTAIWFLLPVVFGFRFISVKTNIKNIKQFLFGTSIVLALFIGVIYLLGILNDYLFWAIEYGIFTLPKQLGQIKPPDILSLLKALFPFSIGFVFLLNIKENNKEFKLIPWIIAGMFGAYPRWELFHLLPSVPFLAITIALVISQYKNLNILVKTAVVIWFAVFLFMLGRFVSRNINQPVRFLESDVLATAKYIDEKTEDGQKIYVLNAWDNIYALSNTIPTSRPWIPFLPWYFDVPGVSQELVGQLNNEDPEFIIEGEYTQTGLGSQRIKEVDDLIQKKYELVNKIGKYNIYKLN